MDKRYQVFVSSTFQDLQEERQEVMQALLELDCIPAGMELFPAANEDQWSLIQKVIDDCDYYIVIVGGRYGSIGPNGISYTEMEYRYATEQGKPAIAFLHRDPGAIIASRTESSKEGKEKLSEFRALIQQKMCRYWDNPADLGSQVSRSLVKLIKSNPAVGWVRADQMPDERAAREILRMQQRIEELQARLASAQTQPPQGTEELAQGDDTYVMHYSFRATYDAFGYASGTSSANLPASWNTIFGILSPLMIEEAKESTLRSALNGFLSEQSVQLGKNEELKGASLSDFQIIDDDFHTIKVQLRALGLITKSSRQRSVKDSGTYWTLTPYGDSVMTNLRAIRRSG